MDSPTRADETMTRGDGRVDRAGDNRGWAPWQDFPRGVPADEVGVDWDYARGAA